MPPAPATHPRQNPVRSHAPLLAKLLLLVIAVRLFLVSPFNIPSESMLPQLMIGDYLIVAKWPYGYSRFSFPVAIGPAKGRFLGGLPQRGDIVVFKAPPSGSQDYVKRVIGLPGDRIAVRDGVLVLNGRPVPRRRIADLVEPLTPNSACATADSRRFRERGSNGEERCRYVRYRETLPGGLAIETLDMGTSLADNFPEIRVPAGMLFMMGDNRDRSADSRFAAIEGKGIGLVPAENLIGKALVVVYSTDGTARWLSPSSWYGAARGGRAGLAL